MIITGSWARAQSTAASPLGMLSTAIPYGASRFRIWTTARSSGSTHNRVRLPMDLANVLRKGGKKARVGRGGPPCGTFRPYDHYGLLYRSASVGPIGGGEKVGQ